MTSNSFAVGVVIQARMGSQRLPGKVLMDIGGQPLIAHVLDRVQRLTHSVTTIVATSSKPQDDLVASYCSNSNVGCYRGSEDDVLARYYECAKEYKFGHIVRLTCDNPFTDVEELDNLIDFHIENENDYSHSFGELPVGVGCEIFSFRTLEISHAKGSKLNHREHVNEYLEENRNDFKIGQLRVCAEKFKPELRLTVDTKEDYERTCHLVAGAEGAILTTEELVKLCSHSA